MEVGLILLIAVLLPLLLTRSPTDDESPQEEGVAFIAIVENDLYEEDPFNKWEHNISSKYYLYNTVESAIKQAMHMIRKEAYFLSRLPRDFCARNGCWAVENIITYPDIERLQDALYKHALIGPFSRKVLEANDIAWYDYEVNMTVDEPDLSKLMRYQARQPDNEKVAMKIVEGLKKVDLLEATELNYYLEKKATRLVNRAFDGFWGNELGITRTHKHLNGWVVVDEWNNAGGTNQIRMKLVAVKALGQDSSDAEYQADHNRQFSD